MYNLQLYASKIHAWSHPASLPKQSLCNSADLAMTTLNQHKICSLPGTVVCVLNPNLMETKMEKTGEPAFTVKDPAQVSRNKLFT